MLPNTTSLRMREKSNDRASFGQPNTTSLRMRERSNDRASFGQPNTTGRNTTF